MLVRHGAIEGPSLPTNMFVQFRPDVDVCSLDGTEDQLRHALALLVDQVRLEERLARPEPLSAHLGGEY